VKRQTVHWRNVWGEPACHVPSITLPLRTTRDPAMVACEWCLTLIPRYLAIARDADSLTLPEV
jgi:hypothetical protein